MLDNIFFSQAFAQANEAANHSEVSFSSFVPLILIFGIFYFLIIRPQSKKIKEQQQLIDGLKIGNKVVTNTGIHGVVRGIDAKIGIVDLEIAKDVIIKINRMSIANLSETKEEDKSSKNSKAKDKSKNKAKK